MSAASAYGVEVVASVVLPAFDDAHIRLETEPETGAGDLIAYIMHWVEAQGGDPEVAIGHATRHWDAERGEGDDIAQDEFYDEMTDRLKRREHAAR